jgi:hypothetical protein
MVPPYCRYSTATSAANFLAERTTSPHPWISSYRIRVQYTDCLTPGETRPWASRDASFGRSVDSERLSIRFS